MPVKHHITFSRDWMFDLTCLFVLFIVFYTCWLGSYPFFIPDEGRYSEVAREMVASHDYITPRVNGVAFLDKPVLYYWFQALAIRLFGIKEWGLRLFPALFGVLGCLMTYVSGRYLFDRRTGFIAALILATAPLYFASAHYANLDLEVAVLVSCTLFSFIIATLTNQRWFYFFTYLFAGLAFLTKGLIAIAFPGLIGGLWMIIMQRFDLLKKMALFRGALLFLMIVLPWYLLVQQANPNFFHYFFVTQQVTRFLSAAHFNNATPFWFYLPIVLIGFFPWTLFAVQAIVRNSKQWLSNRHQYGAELFLFLWIAVVFVFFSIPRSKTIGYILPIFPPLALLTGHFIAQTWDNVQEKKIHWIVLLFALGTSALAVCLPFAYRWIVLPELFLPHLLSFSCLFALSSLCGLCLLRQKKLLPFFSLCFITNVIFLCVLTSNANHLNQNSAKPLIAELKNVLGPEDEVINYFKFYQDIPLYLEQRITLVANWNDPAIPEKDNWIRELWFGLPFQKTNDWIINETEFWQRFNSTRRVFVFLNTNYFDQFKAQASHYFILGKTNDIILLSNKPTLLTKNP